MSWLKDLTKSFEMKPTGSPAPTHTKPMSQDYGKNEGRLHHNQPKPLFGGRSRRKSKKGGKTRRGKKSRRR